MAFRTDEVTAVTVPKIGVSALLSLALSAGGIIGTYSVLQHRVSNTESRIDKLDTDISPLRTDVAVMKAQVQMTSDTVQRIERKLDK